MKLRPPLSWTSMALGAAGGAVVGFLFARKKSAPPGERTDPPFEPGTFEWGETAETDAFFDRHPNFYPAFERLVTLSNK